MPEKHPLKYFHLTDCIFLVEFGLVVVFGISIAKCCFLTQKSGKLKTYLLSGFLFGYEDELACITDFAPIAMDSDPKEEPSNDDFWMNGDDWDDEEWDEEEPNTVDDIFRSKRSVPSYRDPSGKCLWGILKDLNNTEHETIRYYKIFRVPSDLQHLNRRTNFQKRPAFI